MSLRDWARKVRDLRGNLLGRPSATDVHVALSEAEAEAERVEERERKIASAATMATHVKRHRGAGWFPGDPL